MFIIFQSELYCSFFFKDDHSILTFIKTVGKYNEVGVNCYGVLIDLGVVIVMNFNMLVSIMVHRFEFLFYLQFAKCLENCLQLLNGFISKIGNRVIPFLSHVNSACSAVFCVSRSSANKAKALQILIKVPYS